MNVKTELLKSSAHIVMLLVHIPELSQYSDSVLLTLVKENVCDNEINTHYLL